MNSARCFVAARRYACLVLLVWLSPTSGLAEEKPIDFSQDLAPFIELAGYLRPAPLEEQDPKTGFVVGGRNDTLTIRSLTEINGRPIAELEADMRPGAKSDVGSRLGFLGPDESLLEVLAADNDYVLGELGLSHQQLGRHLHALAAIGLWLNKRKTPDQEFVYLGQRFEIEMEFSRGVQLSPFRDGTSGGTNARLRNLGNGKRLTFALLVADLIERYGFYEGHGTPYRVSPQAIAEALGLSPKPTR